MSDLDRAVAAIEAEALQGIERAATVAELKKVEVAVLGRKGTLTQILRGLKDLPEEGRKAAARGANALKRRLEETFAQRERRLGERWVRSELAGERLDPTEPGPERPRGHEHPVQALRRELEDLFRSMGFAIVDGPEVETEYYNFEALNIPADHPARDLQDTFWLHGGQVLRTHTSGIQIRAMQRWGAPLRIVAPGRVFRQETQDASHEHTFHQIEGLLIDEDVSIAHLKGVLDAVLEALFHGPVKTRFRPSYFPFVEPGLELDMECRVCGGRGCATCKGEGYVEMLGCGMVHPRVLAAGGVDAERFGGFAFGMGIDRLALMRHAIHDIRLFMSGDLRFLEQF